jgi:hypothetical protein
MVDRYTKIVLTVIAVLLAGLLVRSLLEAQPAVAQLAPACGTLDRPCAVSLVGGPVAGAWQGAPLVVYDGYAEARAAQTPPACGRANDPCYGFISGGPGGGWQGAPLVILDSHRIVPRRTP